MLTDPEDDYSKGFVPFLDCTIHLDSRPLIPRTETEFWTEKAIEKIKTFVDASTIETELRVLDLFTGSGAVGVAVLKHVPNSFVDFGEIDQTHASTIHKNILENGISPERSRVLITDVWSDITDRYDFILANPPYIDESLALRVQTSVTSHEPLRALFAPDRGFALLEKMMRGLHSHLSKKGIAWIEHEPEHAERILDVARELHLHADLKKDQYGLVRYSELTFVA